MNSYIKIDKGYDVPRKKNLKKRGKKTQNLTVGNHVKQWWNPAVGVVRGGHPPPTSSEKHLNSHDLFLILPPYPYSILKIQWNCLVALNFKFLLQPSQFELPHIFLIKSQFLMYYQRLPNN